MVFVVDFDDTPGVSSTTDSSTVDGLDLVVSTDDSEGNLRQDLSVFCDSLLVVELVAGTLEDLDVVVLDVCEDLIHCQ